MSAYHTLIPWIYVHQFQQSVSVGNQQPPPQVTVIVQPLVCPNVQDSSRPSSPEPEQLPSLVKVSEVAKVLRKSPKAVYSMIARGQLPTPVRMGRRVYLRRTDMIEWLERAASSSERRRRR